MKSATSIFFLVLLTSSVYAQEYFINAGMGGGLSGASSTVYPGNIFGDSKTIFSDCAQLIIGRTYGRIEVETGISYLRTGGDHDVRLSFGGFYNGPFAPLYATEVKFGVRNDHLMIPMIVSYIINKDRKLSFHPGMGVEAAYNFKGKIINQHPGLNDFTPSTNNKTISAILLLKFDVQYRITKRWGVWGGVAYHQMITSLTTSAKAYDFAGIFNAGVQYDIHSHKHA